MVWGCVLLGGCPLVLGGVWLVPGGCLLRGVPASGLGRGVPASGPEGGCIPAFNGTDPPLWTESQTLVKTRLHSSRMHTACSLTVSPIMLCWGGGACSWGVPASGECLLPGGGGGIPVCTEADLPPPVDRILDTCFWKYYLAPNFVAGGNNLIFRSHIYVIV